MLASCENCCYGSGKKCELRLRPSEGEPLCDKYAMSVSFREHLISLLRQDIRREVNQAALMVNFREAEKAQAFAG